MVNGKKQFQHPLPFFEDRPNIIEPWVTQRVKNKVPYFKRVYVKELMGFDGHEVADIAKYIKENQFDDTCKEFPNKMFVMKESYIKNENDYALYLTTWTYLTSVAQKGVEEKNLCCDDTHKVRSRLHSRTHAFIRAVVFVN
jgi:hypothetical protein